MAYREAGTGRPLALLHSKGLSHREWEPGVDELAPRYRLVLPDLPLHGDSEDRPRHPYTPDWLAEVMAGFVRETCGPRPLAGGHEVGAQILLKAVASRQLTPGRLVLMSSSLHRPPERDRLERAVGLVMRAGAVPGLDRAISHGARLAFRPAAGERLTARSNPAARDLVRHALGGLAGNPNRARSGRRCIGLGMSTSRSGLSEFVAIACRRICAPASCPPTSGRGPHTSRQKPAITSASQSGV